MIDSDFDDEMTPADRKEWERIRQECGVSKSYDASQSPSQLQPGVDSFRKFENNFAGRDIDAPRPEPTARELKMREFSKVWDQADASGDIRKSTRTYTEHMADFRAVWD